MADLASLARDARGTICELPALEGLPPVLSAMCAS
jgi:hypothetical protein